MKLRRRPQTKPLYRFYSAWKPECDSEHYQISVPEGGCFNYHWDRYTDEVILINLLAIGSPPRPVENDIFYAWERTQGTYGGHTLVHSLNGSFFTYVFAHLWVDFATLGEDHHPTQPVNWWDNSVEAAWANWQFVVDHQDTACDGDDNHTTYGETSWGLTACEGQDRNYHAYGALPAAWYDHDGTIAPYGAGMAVMLCPEKAILALKRYFANTDLWRYRFGFGDAYNLDPPDCNGPWYNHVAFGIDQGPMLISIENYRSGLMWDTMKRNDHLCQALHSIWPTFLCVPISGPTVGAMNTAYAFTATVKPTVTTPITYVWQATDQSPVTHAGSLSHTDVVTFTWSVTCTQAITVTAISSDYTGTDTHFINIGRMLYLPLILRNYNK